VTIAVGSGLLLLNILVFVAIYRQRHKTTAALRHSRKNGNSGGRKHHDLELRRDVDNTSDVTPKMSVGRETDSNSSLSSAYSSSKPPSSGDQLGAGRREPVHTKLHVQNHHHQHACAATPQTCVVANHRQFASPYAHAPVGLTTHTYDVPRSGARFSPPHVTILSSSAASPQMSNDKALIYASIPGRRSTPPSVVSSTGRRTSELGLESSKTNCKDPDSDSGENYIYPDNPSTLV